MKNHIVLNAPSPKKIKNLVANFLLQDEVNNLLILTQDPLIPFNYFKSQQNLIRAAGGMVKNDLAELLFIFRNEKWDLPKGRIEMREEVRQAAIREVKEETGLSDVYIKRKFGETYHIYNIKKRSILKHTIWFEMTASQNAPLKPQTEEGITDVKWIDIAELDNILTNTYPSISDLMSKYQKKKG